MKYKLNTLQTSKEYEAIAKRKEAIVKSIEEQNGLTPELDKKIQQSFDLQELRCILF
jgi:uncharacterized protein